MLSPSSDLKADTLEFALGAARQSPGFIIPGDASDIEDAIAALRASTMRPVWMDDDDASVYVKTMLKACEDYPIDCVQQACVNWRKVPDHGKWWPTEQDLRTQCEKVFAPRRSLFNKARVLLQDLRAKEAEAQRANVSAFPGERQRRFRAEMEKRMGTRTRFEAYFDGRQMDFQGEDTILVRTPIAESVLLNEGRDLIKSLRLKVRYAPAHFVNIKSGRDDEETADDRAEVSCRFANLKARMGGLA